MRFRDLPRSGQTLVFINAAAAAIAAACVSPLWQSVPWQHMLLAVLLAVALFHIAVRPADGKGQMSFGFAAMLGAAILWGPANGALVGWLAGALSTLGPDMARHPWDREGPALPGGRALYNGCTGCLASAAAGGVYHAGMAAPLPGTGMMWLPGAAAALAFFAVSTWLMAAIIATTTGRDVLGFWCAEMLPTLPQYAIGGAAAMLFVHLLQAGHWGGLALLAIGPMYALQECYRRGAEALGQRRRQIARLREANAPLVASLAGAASATGTSAPGLRTSRIPRNPWTGGRRACAGSVPRNGGAEPADPGNIVRPTNGRIAGRRLSLALRNPTDLNDMVEALAREALQMAPGTTAVVALSQGDGSLRVAAATGLYGDRLLGICLDRAASTWGQALKQGRAILNLPPDVAILDAIPSGQPPGLRSALVVPLIHEQDPLGVVCVYHSRGGAYAERHAERLGLVGEIIAESLAAAVRRSADQRLPNAGSLASRFEDNAMAQALEGQLDRARTIRTPFAAVLVDLGDIQAAQDALGPGASEDPMREAANVIPSCVRPTDSVSPLAGNRFLVLLNDTTLNSCIHVCARIVTALDRMAERGGLSAGASAGFGLYPDDGTTVRALMDAVDARMARDRATRKPQS